ncbi:MAG: nuclear transport factor 2 family protein [Marinovum sp.]|nr:nuclear transport factor 2 family protein [Marinovum sp.]
MPQDFVSQYESALGTQEWAQVAPLIHDGARVVFSNGRLLEGKAAIKDAYEANFRAIEGEDFRIENVQWLTSSDASAAYMFDFHWAGIINGTAASGAGRGMAVLINMGEA